MLPNKLYGLFLWVFLFIGADTTAQSSFKRGCPALRVKNAKAIYNGMFARYRCLPGYTTYGEKIMRCADPPHWSSPPPKCVKPTCKAKPKNILNGSSHKSHRKAVYDFFCYPGFDLRGPVTIYCDGQKWSDNSPICLQTGHQPKMFCDFEDPDICGWTQDLNHNFDWTRHTKHTPSWHTGTGPNHDHTKGINGNGFYMYTEATAKKVNDTARLISPIFDKSLTPDHPRQDATLSNSEGYCLEFFYHMYGKTLGELRVFIRKISSSDNWILKPDDALFRAIGDQGNEWKRYFSVLGYIDDDFQIVFEAVMGTSFLGDIAIDDVRLIPNCTDEEIDDFTFPSTMETETSDFEPASCENNCGLVRTSNETKILINNDTYFSCDCDSMCFIRGTCCPDVFSECFLDTNFANFTDETFTYSADYSDTTDAYTFTTEDYSEETTDFMTDTTEYSEFSNGTRETAQITTDLPTTISKNSTITPATVSSSTKKQMKPNNEIDENPFTKSTLKSVEPTTRIAKKLPVLEVTTTKKKAHKKTTTTKRPYKKTKKYNSTKKPPTKTTPIKSIKLTTPKQTTRITSTTTPSTTTSKKITTKVIPVRITQQIKEEDAGEIPIIKENMDKDDNSIYISKESRYGSENMHTGNKRTAVWVGVSVAIVVILTGIIFYAQRYCKHWKYGTLRPKRRRRGYGESQDEVHFMKCDEALDFRLASEVSEEHIESDTYGLLL